MGLDEREHLSLPPHHLRNRLGCVASNPSGHAANPAFERIDWGHSEEWSPKSQTKRLRLLAWVLGAAKFMIGGSVGAILSITALILGAWLLTKH